MKKTRNTLLAAALVALCCNAGQAPAMKFTPLGDLPGGNFYSGVYYGGVSDDGSVVVGESDSALAQQAFRWTSGGGMVVLGDLPGGSFYSEAEDLSADGSVVVGVGSSALSDLEAFRWTSGGGMVGLGDLPGGVFESDAHAVSANGSVVVGSSISASGLEAFRWTSDGGMVGLGDLPGGIFSSTAEDVSADGTVIVGVGNLDFETFTIIAGETFRWTSAGGMVGLGDLPGGPFLSAPSATSADGSVVVGVGNGDLGTDGAEAFRWTSGGGMVGLGDLAGGIFSSIAWDVSADGSVVVGAGTSASGEEAFRWTSDGGMRNLRELLISGGATGLNGWRLNHARAVSADGHTIVGFGTNPRGRTEAWLAIISEPGDFDLDGSLTALDIDLLSAEVRNGRTNRQFDVNGDSLIDQQDRNKWVRELRRTYFGDANLDGEFNSGDLVAVFGAGQYEDAAAKNSTWSSGDWNGDAEFDTSDLVLAFQDGGYEQGPRASVTAVPEPASWTFVCMAFLAPLARRRRIAACNQSVSLKSTIISSLERRPDYTRKTLMKKTRNTLLCTALVALCCRVGHAAATFTPLGDLPGRVFHSAAFGVSADGSVIVGESSSASGPEAFRWMSGGGMAGLGDLPGGALFESSAADVSADGSVIVGTGNGVSHQPGSEAFRSTSGGGMVGLGDLPGGNFYSFARGVSDDGSIVVGESSSASGVEAFRWTTGGGMVGLGDLPGGGFESGSEDISADGSVIVGYGTSASGYEAFRWTSGGGMVGLGGLPGGDFESGGFGVSADGSVVFGQNIAASGIEAFHWTAGGGMVGLGDLPGGAFESDPYDISADGSIIVGLGTSALGKEAFLWTAGGGMQNLRELLIAGGATGLTDWTLTEAHAMSADGRTIVGYGRNPRGQTEAWLATVPEPGDFDLDGVLTALDIDLLSAEIRNGGANLLFDVNGDSLIDQQDRSKWVRELRRTYFGDANVDGEFNSGDLVAVFGAGQYEDADAKNSTWSTGDWNGNAEFDTSDLVLAFQDGGYEQGPRASVTAVPEPASWTFVGIAFVATLARRGRVSTFDASHPTASLQFTRT